LQRPWRDGVFELTDCIGYATPDGIVAGGREDVRVIGTLSACVVSLSLEHQMAARQISISGITSDQRRSRFHLRFRPRAVLDIDGAQSHSQTQWSSQSGARQKIIERNTGCPENTRQEKEAH
jgi:hypothetical protein